MPKPTLYVFAISHYCEKGRWALDHHALDYELKHLAPGHHQAVAKRLGFSRGSLPILVDGDQNIQGSAAIVDWAERVAGVSAEPECREIEERLDRVAGVHVRRYYYSEALVEFPKTVRPLFTGELPIVQKVLVSAGWGAIRRLMIKGMDLGFEQGHDSRRIVDEELSWIDDKLSDGRRFLVGERFSRADLAAASLLSPLVAPIQHPVYAGLRFPPRLNADLEQWRGRPSLAHVREMYARYR